MAKHPPTYVSVIDCSTNSLDFPNPLHLVRAVFVAKRRWTNMNFQDLCCGGACKGLCQKGFILQKGQGSQRGLKGVSRYHRVNKWKGGAAGSACRAGARMVPNCKWGAETEDPVMEAVRGFHICVIISFFWVMFRFFSAANCVSFWAKASIHTLSLPCEICTLVLARSSRHRSQRFTDGRALGSLGETGSCWLGRAGRVGGGMMGWSNALLAEAGET